MTGFGSAVGGAGESRISLEIRTVNHRFFNPSIKLPSAFSRWEGDLRERLRQRIARGHVTLFVQLDRPPAARGTIDEERFALYVEQLRRLSSEHKLAAPDLSAVLRLPGVVAAPSSEEEPEADLAQLVALLDTGLAALDTMRVEEGRRMGEFLLARVGLIDEAVGRIETRAPARLEEQVARLRQNVAELLAGVRMDEQRLAQEIAVMADRMDIAEEIDRLRSHVGAFRASLTDGSGEPVGKRLGFILQEMLREVNTIGSKGADVAILRDVVVMKEELERVREQAENIE